jgi:arylsulfatase A-like enzyme
MKYNVKLLAGLLPLVACNQNQTEQPKAPNIMVILVDDMGFSDLGCTGAEIVQTPNIDYLAENGILADQFYNAARSCPSRAALLTGYYPHQVDIGWMTASDLGREGYHGDLDTNAYTIPEVLKQANYETYMTGKWHVTHKAYQTPDGPKHNWPHNRGFDRFYGVLSGGGGYYRPRILVDDDKAIEIPEGFYLTNSINDSTESYLEQHFASKKEQPFFFYVAHYAPHFPLHALPEDIALFEGKFDIGWDSLRAKRYSNQLAMGLVDSTWTLPPRDPGVPEWSSLPDTSKAIWARAMEVYAAQMYRMDIGVGQIIETLKKHGELDNTVILFLSDNGATSESIGKMVTYDRLDKLGTDETYISYRTAWANVSNTPFQMYKSYAHEGGVATPLLVHWPEKIKNKGEIVRQRGHVIDLMTTFMSIAQVGYPDDKQDVLPALPGVDLLPAFLGETFERESLFFEHESNRAIIKGDWKLVAAREGWPWKIGPWKLFNIKEDRTEMHNVIEQYPEVAEKLENEWKLWAEDNHVLPIDARSWGERIDASVK